MLWHPVSMISNRVSDIEILKDNKLHCQQEQSKEWSSELQN